MIAGIAIDSWKLEIFKQKLDEASYTYTQHPGITPDTLLLKVEYVNLEPLRAVVKKKLKRSVQHGKPKNDTD